MYRDIAPILGDLAVAADCFIYKLLDFAKMAKNNLMTPAVATGQMDNICAALLHKSQEWYMFFANSLHCQPGLSMPAICSAPKDFKSAPSASLHFLYSFPDKIEEQYKA